MKIKLQPEDTFKLENETGLETNGELGHLLYILDILSKKNSENVYFVDIENFRTVRMSIDGLHNKYFNDYDELIYNVLDAIYWLSK